MVAELGRLRLTMRQKFVVHNMLENGFMLNSIAAALDVEFAYLEQYIDDHKAEFELSYQIGYDWRNKHSMSEWPDYVWDGRLVGRKSAYWDKIPWAQKVDTTIDPEFVIDVDTREHRKFHFTTYGSMQA